MKKLLAILLALTFIFTLAACSKKEEKTDDAVKKQENAETVKTGVYYYTRMTKIENGEEKDRELYTFDDKNRIVKCEFVSDFESITLQYSYDDLGNIVRNHMNYDGAIRVREFKYNDKGDVTERKYSEDEIEKIEYEYDSDGKISKIVATRTYQGDRSVTTIIVERKDGKITAATASSEYSAPEYNEHYKAFYNENEKLTKIMQIDAEGNENKFFERIYNDKGFCVEETEYDMDDGSISSSDIYEYDDKGNIIKSKNVYGSSTYEYECDKNGNITYEKITSSSNSGYEPSVSEFKYYDYVYCNAFKDKTNASPYNPEVSDMYAMGNSDSPLYDLVTLR